MGDIDLFHRILKTAIDGEASDVHLKIGSPVVFRINQELVTIEAPAPTKEWMENVIDQIVPTQLKNRLQEDHEVDFSYYHPDVGRFRTNCYQQRGEFCLAMRYVQRVIPSFEELNLLPVLRDLAESPRGIVLVGGITGSGKSTTLAAMLDHINANYRKHVITLEDPIEFVLTDNECLIEQREIGLDTHSFGFGLKHVLRQDPDVIMIGEMRDDTSFSAAMTASDTGHLVLSTLHTNDAGHSVGRILDFFKAEERERVRRQVASALKAVVCQRMCHAKDGGVIPAFEILVNNSSVQKLIEENKLDKLPNAIETGGDSGMLTFNQSLFNLVKEGKVEEKEALAKADNPHALEMNFKGIFLDEGRRIMGEG